MQQKLDIKYIQNILETINNCADFLFDMDSRGSLDSVGTERSKPTDFVRCAYFLKKLNQEYSDEQNIPKLYENIRLLRNKGFIETHGITRSSNTSDLDEQTALSSQWGEYCGYRLSFKGHQLLMLLSNQDNLILYLMNNL